jgi:hypothetical protein
MKVSLSDATVKLKGELISAQDALEEQELEGVKVQESKSLIEGKLRRAEEAYRKERNALEAQGILYDKETDQLESRLIELRDMTAEESRAAQAARLITDLKAQMLTKRETHNKKKKEINKAIIEAVTTLADYKESIQERLGQVKEMATQRLRAMLEMQGHEGLGAAYDGGRAQELDSHTSTMYARSGAMLSPVPASITTRSSRGGYAEQGGRPLSNIFPPNPPSPVLRSQAEVRSV